MHALIAAQGLEETAIEVEAAISQANNVVQLVAICVLAVGREAHHLAFISVLLVADELANHGIETAQRVGQENAIEYLNPIAFAAGHHGGNEVSGAVVTEARGFIPG